MTINFTEFHFLRPLWLLAFLPGLLIIIKLWRNRRQQGNWSAVCDPALLPFILEQKLGKASRWPLLLGTLIGSILIFALAGPTWERLPSPAFRNTAALVIALDLSTSMDAGDIKPSRLIRARYKIADILKLRKDGQTALLVYAGDAFTVTPLSSDIETIDNQLSALTTDIVPVQGNNTTAAIQKAIDLLKQAGLQKGEILLVTDGANADEALDTAKALGNYTLSILAVGTAEGAPIKAPQGDFVKDANGNIIVPKLDAAELAKLTHAGHGVLVGITDNNSDIESLSRFFEQSVHKEGAESENLLLQQWADQGPWLILLILPLAALFFRKGLVCIALLLCFPLPKNSQAMEWRDLWQTKDQQAQRAFQQKDYKTAAQMFQNPEWQAAAQYKAGNYLQAVENLKKLQTADSFYNQGNALAQSGQLPEALKAYEQALKLKPDDADTKFNKDLVEKALKKQQQENQNQNQPGNPNQKDAQQSKSEQDANDSNQGQKGQASDQNSEQSQSKQADQPDSSEDSQNPTKQPENKPKPKSKQEQDKAEQKTAEQGKQENDSKQGEQPVPNPVTEPQTELTQANEQWLKRIPDDPSGLLKRKFKYQYRQRQNKMPTEDPVE